jgi:hypothetical protein
VGCDVGFAAGALGECSAANVADNLSAGASENNLFVFTVVAFYTQKSAFGFVCIICCHAAHSTNSNFFALKPFLWCAFLHTVHLYFNATFLVGLSPPGTLENLPALPIPVCLFFCLTIIVREEALPFLTLSKETSVCFLQNGQ